MTHGGIIISAPLQSEAKIKEGTKSKGSRRGGAAGATMYDATLLQIVLPLLRALFSLECRIELGMWEVLRSILKAYTQIVQWTLHSLPMLYIRWQSFLVYFHTIQHTYIHTIARSRGRKRPFIKRAPSPSAASAFDSIFCQICLVHRLKVQNARRTKPVSREAVCLYEAQVWWLFKSRRMVETTIFAGGRLYLS